MEAYIHSTICVYFVEIFNKFSVNLWTHHIADNRADLVQNDKPSIKSWRNINMQMDFMEFNLRYSYSVLLCFNLLVKSIQSKQIQ